VYVKSEENLVMDIPNVGKIECLIKMSQIFKKDGVHFTETAGNFFLDALM
jgi:hypothetical protein